jgi:ribonuclease P protein component
VVAAVRTRTDFAALSRSRSRSRSGALWVVRADAPDLRVAYAIGRAVGGAVVRNRLRRRLRALVAEADRTGGLAPGHYLVGADASAVGTPFPELRRHLLDALGRLR